GWRSSERGLRLPVGQRRQSRSAREVLRAVRRQEFVAALFIHVRPKLGQALPVLHVADGWVWPELVPGQPGRCFRRDRQGAGRKDQRLGERARMVADPAAVRLRVDVSEGLWVPRYEPWRDRRRSAGRDACVQETRWQDFSFLERRSGRRYGVAVLESDGLHAGRSDGTAGAAEKLQAGVFREAYFEEIAPLTPPLRPASSASVWRRAAPAPGTVPCSAFSPPRRLPACRPRRFRRRRRRLRDRDRSPSRQ